MKKNLLLYRYIDYPAVGLDGLVCGADIHLMRYTVRKETPKGYWINGTSRRTGGRWVSKTSRKRYAHADIDQARTSFTCRKRSQLAHLKRQTIQTKSALKMSEGRNFKTQGVRFTNEIDTWGIALDA